MVKAKTTDKASLMLIQAVHFYRTERDKKNGKGERGIIINNGESIIDSFGKPVDSVWDYTTYAHILTVHLPLNIW